MYIYSSNMYISEISQARIKVDIPNETRKVLKKVLIFRQRVHAMVNQTKERMLFVQMLTRDKKMPFFVLQQS